MKAADIMVSNVITVNTDSGVLDVAKILIANRISAVPVVDKRGTLVGIISEGDLMRRPEIGTQETRSWWLDALDAKRSLADEFVRSHSRKVNEVMTRVVITAKPDDSLNHIATLLEKHHIKRVPIVSDGKIAGIVSRANLVQALASQTEERGRPSRESDSNLRGILFARLQEAPLTTLKVPNVFVHNGIVQIWGTVDSENERTVARVTVEATPGVRGLVDHLLVQAPRKRTSES